MSKKVAVLLSGCGHLDGAEINEAVMSLLALRLQGLKPQIFSPNIMQKEVVDHLNNQKRDSTDRNVLTESARIARGEILPLKDWNPDVSSAVFIPGGFGVAKNFCDFAERGAAAAVDPILEEKLIYSFEKRLPMGAVCIAPALLALVASKLDLKLTMTLGELDGYAYEECERLGQDLRSCQAGECVVDENHHVVSTPAFMLDISLDQAWPGIQRAAQQISHWVGA